MIRRSGFDHLLETLKQNALELAEEPEEDDRDGFEVQ
jgi:hypothetical protein